MGKDEGLSQDGDGGRDRTDATATAPSGATEAELAVALAAAKDSLLRSLAEQDNIRRQGRRDRDETARYAVAGFAGDLLTTADNLERAIASVPQDRRLDGTIAGLLAGVEATQRALLESFARHGLHRLDPIGRPFDPHRHEASFEVADDDQPPGTVVSVIQPGYTHHDRLLRPALVGISKAAGEPLIEQSRPSAT